MLALAFAAPPLAAQQSNAGQAEVGAEALVQSGQGAPQTPGPGPDQIGWLGSFQQSFGSDGVFTLALNTSTDGANWRDGNNQIAWRNLPFAGGRWFLRAGTINFATDLLPLHFASLYSPAIDLSGGAIEYHLRGVHFTFFAGRELIQQGPYLPFFTSTPSGIGGLQALATLWPHLTLEGRYYHSRSSAPETITDPLLAELPRASDNFFLDADYRPARNDDWLAELSFSRSRPAPGGGPGPAQDSLSYFFGPILSRPAFDIQAYAIRETADYLPLANFISGDRTGAFTSLDLHPGTRWSLSTTLADFQAGATGVAAFPSSDAVSASAAASFIPGNGYSLTASASRGRVSPTGGGAGPVLGLTTAQLQAGRAYGDNRSYLRFQDWASASSEPNGNSSVHTTSFEQDRLIGGDSLSGTVSLQQSSSALVTLNGQLGGNLALGRWLTLSGSAELGRDLRDQTALSLETYRTVMILAALHLPRRFQLSAQWIHNAAVSQLNPARALVGLGAGPVALLPALSQQTLLLRLTKTVHWGHGVPLLAGLSEADAERLVPTYTTVSGLVFNDRLGTGVWAPGDAGVGGIEVTLSGRTAVTDAQGRFTFPAVRSGEYQLTLDLDHLPAQFSAPDAAAQTLRVGARATARIAIPIQSVGVISGAVLANGRPLAGAELLLYPDPVRRLAPLYAFTDAQGHYAFQDVLPGRYRVHLQLASVPPGATLAAPPPPVTLASGGSVRGLVLRVQAPVANQTTQTTIEPAEVIALPPTVGQASPLVGRASPASGRASSLVGQAPLPGAWGKPGGLRGSALPATSPESPHSAWLLHHRRGGLRDIFFALNRAALSPRARRTLRHDAVWLRAHPALPIVVEGFGDLRGGTRKNLAVGQRRADAARAYLNRLGIAAARVRAISGGKTSQFCPRNTAACWPQNRRDHFIIAAGSR